MDYSKIFRNSKCGELQGRYITNEHIAPLLYSFQKHGEIEIFGRSVLKKPIYSYRIGAGKKRVLVWSQMHGNESTTTKAMMDFIKFLNGGTTEASQLLGYFSFCIIPVLNPDGAQVYTRENASGIDLNRDATDRTQPESIAIRNIFDTFRPHYCFNMHDQRTIFGVGETRKPATVSFLAPAYNESCEINGTRSSAIHVINAMNKTLQLMIPGQVGRFDDTFNINCIGDNFQFSGTPTILIEAGHYPQDYKREITRQFVFIAFLSGMNAIYENVIVGNEIDQYMLIPQNNPNFFDLVYKNIKIDYDNSEIITNFAAHYTEELSNNRVEFKAFIVKIGDLSAYSGHYEYDAGGKEFRDEQGSNPSIFQPADFRLGDEVTVCNGCVVTSKIKHDGSKTNKQNK